MATENTPFVFRDNFLIGCLSNIFPLVLFLSLVPETLTTTGRLYMWSLVNGDVQQHRDSFVPPGIVPSSWLKPPQLSTQLASMLWLE